MAKTEVILIHNVTHLGAESDQVTVAAGYARNYLFPQRLAIPLTSANKRQLEALRKRRGEREAKELNTMTELASTLSKLTLLIKVKTGDDGKLFGSVTAANIADELNHQYDAHMDRRKIHLKEPIKTLGTHEVPLHLHHDVDCVLKVKVESSNPLPPEVQAAAEAAAEPTKPGKAEPAKAAKPEARKERKPRAAKAEKSAAE